MTIAKSLKLPQRPCDICGVSFKPRNKGQLTCSGICEEQYQNKKANERWSKPVVQKENKTRPLRFMKRKPDFVDTGKLWVL